MSSDPDANPLSAKLGLRFIDGLFFSLKTMIGCFVSLYFYSSISPALSYAYIKLSSKFSISIWSNDYEISWYTSSSVNYFLGFDFLALLTLFPYFKLSPLIWEALNTCTFKFDLGFETLSSFLVMYFLIFFGEPILCLEMCVGFDVFETIFFGFVLIMWTFCCSRCVLRIRALIESVIVLIAASRLPAAGLGLIWL